MTEYAFRNMTLEEILKWYQKKYGKKLGIIMYNDYWDTQRILKESGLF